VSLALGYNVFAEQFYATRWTALSSDGGGVLLTGRDRVDWVKLVSTKSRFVFVNLHQPVKIISSVLQIISSIVQRVISGDIRDRGIGIRNIRHRTGLCGRVVDNIHIFQRHQEGGLIFSRRTWSTMRWWVRWVGVAGPSERWLKKCPFRGRWSAARNLHQLVVVFCDVP